MGYITPADEHRNSARDHINDAVQDLTHIVIHRCAGHDEYKTEYKETMRSVLNTLLDIRDDL